MGDRIPLDTFYIMVAQKLGGSSTPTMARRYGEAIQEVIYEQLVQNDSCYWYGFGNFEKSISSQSGMYKDLYNISTGRMEHKYCEPKYVVKFDIANNVIDAMNSGEEKLPRKKYKKKYNRKYQAQEVYYEKKRKKPESMESWIGGLVAEARYRNADMNKENEDGEEGYDED